MGLNLNWSDVLSKLQTLQAEGYTEADLVQMVSDAGARVEGAPDNATSLLYSGKIIGGEAWQAAGALSRNTASEAGADRYVIVDNTPMGKLLIDSSFQRMYRNAISTRL